MYIFMNKRVLHLLTLYIEKVTFLTRDVITIVVKVKICAHFTGNAQHNGITI